MNKPILEKIKEDMDSKQLIYGVFALIIIGVLSFGIMTITFKYASVSPALGLFPSYFQSKWLMLMNIIPIFLLMLLFSLIFNKLWLSFSLTSLIFFTMSVINNYKLIYRDEPVKFIDFQLLTESLNMAGKYKITLTSEMIGILFALVFVTLLLRTFLPYKILSKKIRVSFIAILIITSGILFKSFYFDQNTYNRVGYKDTINIWSETQQFQSKGLVYPFIYSYTESKDRILEDYDEERAIQLLEDKTYSNIPEDKKINIIAIMLEAYNDFSKFDTIEIDESVYEDFHNIVNNSYNGSLVTNVFGGGTVNTEWAFLTGYNSHPKYIKDTNSFIRYFNQQGYKTEAMHPNFGWFYNRRNVNDYLGFDEFDYHENKYGEIQEQPLRDWEFFDYIIEGYEENKKSNKPYINFSVTYQNHGPYPEEKEIDTEYLKRQADDDEKTYNQINNYLSGIKYTGDALKKLTNYFEDQNEPTIIILFGDHNPFLGDDPNGYEMMGIDMDLTTDEGFLNYYTTPYVFWGNERAKKVLDKDFQGEGSEISPNFLMAELFQYLGWEGNPYMKYLFHVKENFTVNHDMYFKTDGAYTKKLSKEKNIIWREFNSVQYYYSRNFQINNTQN